MDAWFACRNGHGWDMRLEGQATINERWVFCPVCGAPPRPSRPVSAWQKVLTWAQRNPVALGLAASIIVLATSAGMFVTAQWRDLAARSRQAEADTEKAISDAEAWQQEVVETRKTIAAQQNLKD